VLTEAQSKTLVMDDAVDFSAMLTQAKDAAAGVSGLIK
jgi:hypothetical protein